MMVYNIPLHIQHIHQIIQIVLLMVGFLLGQDPGREHQPHAVQPSLFSHKNQNLCQLV